MNHSFFNPLWFVVFILFLLSDVAEVFSQEMNPVDSLNPNTGVEPDIPLTTIPSMGRAEPAETEEEITGGQSPNNSNEQSEKNGCLIATATYGSELAPQVQLLREIRDNKLLQSESGSAFISGFNTVYYSFAPTVAQWEQDNPIFKNVVKTAITPLITSLTILNHVSMDSEAEVLGYGISLIILNLGMYFGVPAIVIIGFRKGF